MKKLLLVAALGALVFQSCKKDESSTNQLIGNWNMTSYAVDSNNDNTVQTSEQRTTDSLHFGLLEISNNQIFDSIRMEGLKVSSTYTYSRRGDSVYYSNTILGTEAVFGITKLDATTLNIAIPGYGTGPTEWRYYTRK